MITRPCLSLRESTTTVPGIYDDLQKMARLFFFSLCFVLFQLHSVIIIFCFFFKSASAAQVTEKHTQLLQLACCPSSIYRSTAPRHQQCVHKAAEHVRADQSATTQLSRRLFFFFLYVFLSLFQLRWYCFFNSLSILPVFFFVLFDRLFLFPLFPLFRFLFISFHFLFPIFLILFLP